MESQVIAVTKAGCPACEETKPQIRRAEKKVKKKVRFEGVDVDTNPDIVKTYDIKAFPEFVYTNRHGIVHKMPWQGVPTPQSIVQWIDSVRDKTSSNVQASTEGGGRCTDCASGGGVDPSIWGPPLWFVIHTTALSYPRTPTISQKRDMQRFFQELKDHLPCTYCQKHFAKELSSINSSVFASRASLFEWTVKFHDKVRKRTTGKTSQHSVSYWKTYYKRQVFNFMQYASSEKRR